MHIDKLIKGNKKFRNTTFSNHKEDFDSLVKYGQKPEVLFIGCSDSRVVPDLIVDTLNIFNSLGDRVYGDVGYVGKDFTNLNFLIDIYKIQEHQIEFIFELILWLDSRAIEKSQKRLKAEYDKMKNKNGR